MFDNEYLETGYVLLAAFAGAVTALAFMKWKEMTYPEILLTLFVGASFAIFVTPWLANVALGIETEDARSVAAITYVMASGSNTFLPVIIRYLRRLFLERNGGEETR